MDRTDTVIPPEREVSGPVQVVKVDLAPELTHVDGKEGRLDNRGQYVLQRGAVLGRTVDIDHGTRIAQGREEGKPEDVVVVEVGEKGIGPKGHAFRLRLGLQRPAQLTQPGSQVEDERRLT